MAYSTIEISKVRALPVVLAAAADGRWQSEPGFAEVSFESSAADKLHQVYVDGRLAGSTALAAARSLIVPVSESGAAVIEVLAVDPDDRLTDYSAALAGFGDLEGARVRLSWSGGRYLGYDLDHFDVFGGPAGQVDHSRPLNPEPLPALVAGENLGGWGRGGFGRGGYGRSAMTFSFTTEKNLPGNYQFEVVAVDTSGNGAGELAAQIAIEVAGLPRPPDGLAIAQYVSATQSVDLAWSASPDL